VEKVRKKVYSAFFDIISINNWPEICNCDRIYSSVMLNVRFESLQKTCSCALLLQCFYATFEA